MTLTFLAIILEAAVISQDVVDILVLLTVGALMTLSFAGTMGAVSMEWTIKAAKRKMSLLFSR